MYFLVQTSWGDYSIGTSVGHSPENPDDGIAYVCTTRDIGLQYIKFSPPDCALPTNWPLYSTQGGWPYSYTR